MPNDRLAIEANKTFEGIIETVVEQNVCDHTHQLVSLRNIKIDGKALEGIHVAAINMGGMMGIDGAPNKKVTGTTAVSRRDITDHLAPNTLVGAAQTTKILLINSPRFG